MALFTIPTPVSGINNYSGGKSYGPLESLYSIAESEFMKYPRDLESSTRSHVVLFTIKEIQEVTLSDVVAKASEMIDTATAASDSSILESTKNINWSNLTTTVKEGAQGAVEGVTEAVKNTGETLKSGLKFVATTAQRGGEEMNRLRQLASSRRTNTKAFIALYMPENISFSYDPHYDDNTTLAGVAAATPIVGGAVSAITNVLQNELVKFLLNKAGYVFNPEAQVLFNGISFRSFSMNFTFTPYSKKEAEDVNRIIRMFRTHAAPRRVTSVGGMFFIPPSIFNIDFKFNGADNPYLNKLGDCVIENIEVNYTPNGWAAHTDGAPVQTTVTIQFKEIVLVDRDMIEKQGF